MASDLWGGFTVATDPAVPQGWVIPIKAGTVPRWSAAYKDWGFDDIFPAPPSPFAQVEAWDRDHHGRWIEPTPSPLAAFNSAVKHVFSVQAISNQLLNDQIHAKHMLYKPLTPTEQMAADMHAYAAATDPLRALTRRARRLRRFRWRYEIARKLYPAMENY